MLIANQEIQKAVNILMKIGQFFMTMHILKVLVQMHGYSMGQMSILSRSEYNTSCLGGNIIQRMLQICDKMTICERRFMTQQANYWEFRRIFTADILDIVWFLYGKMVSATCTAISRIFVR